MSRKRVPWDGPNPVPGDYLEARSGGNLWLIRAVEPLRRPDVSGARICLDVIQTPRATLPAGSTVHPVSRIALSDPAGPARVRQIGSNPSQQVMRAAWRDPDDRRTTQRHAREVGGWRVACQLRRMASLQGSRITEEHILGGDHLREIADMAAYGPSADEGLLPITAIAYGPRSGPNAGAEAQVAASVELLRMMRRFSETQRMLVSHVVLFNGALADWCRDGKLNPQVEMGYLLGALDMMVDHFRSEINERLNERAVRAA